MNLRVVVYIKYIACIVKSVASIASQPFHNKLLFGIRFNGHLKKKGISGLVKVNYLEETLSIEVSILRHKVPLLVW